ncbi:MAG: hypothetical protein AB7F98_00210 [Novosphingobium sp.]
MARIIALAKHRVRPLGMDTLGTAIVCACALALALAGQSFLTVQ